MLPSHISLLSHTVPVQLCTVLPSFIQFIYSHCVCLLGTVISRGFQRAASGHTHTRVDMWRYESTTQGAAGVHDSPPWQSKLYWRLREFLNLIQLLHTTRPILAIPTHPSPPPPSVNHMHPLPSPLSPSSRLCLTVHNQLGLKRRVKEGGGGRKSTKEKGHF